ncbi:MAG: hypothetical protein KDI60_19470 [Xanthomonadales bacterium]|nr:hypothetical protein [Xanthomonadales bacterium]
MKVFRIFAAIPAILIWLAMSNASMAAQVQPPWLAMANPNFGLVAGSIVRVQAEPPAVIFLISEALRGDASGEMQLLVDRVWLSQIAPGEGYLALYTDLEPAPLKPRKVLRVPERARLMSFEGVNLSLFRDTPEWREGLLANPLERAAATDYRQQVFAGLQAHDPQWQDLWSGELALRLQRLSPYSAEELALVRQFVLAPQSPATARARLLQTAFDRSPLLGENWYVEAAARILGQTAPRYDSAVGDDQLSYTVLQILAAHPDAVDSRVVEPWLAGVPAIAEAAALILRAQSPEQEREALDRTLSRSLLPAVTRDFLKQHRQRLPMTAADHTQ